MTDVAGTGSQEGFDGVQLSDFIVLQLGDHQHEGILNDVHVQVGVAEFVAHNKQQPAKMLSHKLIGRCLISGNDLFTQLCGMFT